MGVIMGIPRNIRVVLFRASLIGLALLLSAFASYVLFAEPPLKTFTLTINSKQVVVNLPDALPSMDTAIFAGEECFNVKVCRYEFCLNAKLPGHDHVDFVFTDKGEVFALVWMRTTKQELVFWKYMGGMPVLSTLDEIRAIIVGDKRLKES